jgi:phage repressor protein C with HTH and peptisase S24 domain
MEGDSMIPNIQPGDRVVVAPNASPYNGSLVVARLRESGAVMIKIFHRIGDQVKLTSYNALAYPELPYHLTDFRFIYPVYEIRRKTM